jgi:hypothetical protein
VAGQRPVTDEELTGIVGQEVGGGRLRWPWPAAGRADGDLIGRSCRPEAGQLAALPGMALAAGPGAGPALAAAADGVPVGPSSRRGDVLARRVRGWRAAQRRIDSPGIIIAAGARDADGSAKGIGPPVTAPCSQSTARDRGAGRR